MSKIHDQITASKVETKRGDVKAELTDEERLVQLGHVQELRRDFSIWSISALCLCLMATWEALATVVAAALTNGGAPCLFYNYIISFLCSIAVAASLGEIASIYPTAGGQYHWVAALSPPATKSVAAFFTGWISLGGQIVLTASAAFAAGLQLQALVTLNNLEIYIPERWQGMLFYWLVLLYSAALNIWGSRIFPLANLTAGVIHVVAFIAIVIILSVMADKHSADYVFTEFSNSSGWTNDGVSWLVGLLSTVYPFLGYDAACHLSEEITSPARNVPLAMVGSVVINGIMGFGFCIILLFSLGNLDDLLVSPTGFPFIQLFLNVTESAAAATVLSLCIILIAIAANAAGLTSTSRTLWAFARDKATPFSSYLSGVNRHLQVPVRALLLISVLQMVLGFIYLGNTTAFNAILSMAILGMYASYILPIMYMFIYGRKLLSPEEYGPFRMSRTLGCITNIVAISWLILAMVFSTFPGFEPVTPQNMNYCIVVMSGWLIFGAVYYLVFGWKTFQPPEVDRSSVDLVSAHGV